MIWIKIRFGKREKNKCFSIWKKGPACSGIWWKWRGWGAFRPLASCPRPLACGPLCLCSLRVNPGSSCWVILPAQLGSLCCLLDPVKTLAKHTLLSYCNSSWVNFYYQLHLTRHSYWEAGLFFFLNHRHLPCTDHEAFFLFGIWGTWGIEDKDPAEERCFSFCSLGASALVSTTSWLLLLLSVLQTQDKRTGAQVFYSKSDSL